MQSNKDYATQISSLERIIKEYQEHFIMLNGKMKDLEKENQELKEEKRYYKDKYLDLYNSYQNCEDLKRKKAIELLKKKIRFSTYESLKNQIVLFSNDFGTHIYTIYCETKEKYDLLIEVFKL